MSNTQTSLEFLRSQEEVPESRSIQFTGVFHLDQSVEGRRNAIVPYKYYSSTIVPKDPGFLPKQILISDNIIAPSIHPGMTFQISGRITNRFHQYPPVLVPDYQCLPPTPSELLITSTCSKEVRVDGRGKIVHRFNREAFKDVILTVQHQDYDPADLCWVVFYCQYMCDRKYNESYDDALLEVSNVLDFHGHIKGFYESSNTWLIRVASFHLASP